MAHRTVIKFAEWMMEETALHVHKWASLKRSENPLKLYPKLCGSIFLRTKSLTLTSSSKESKNPQNIKGATDKGLSFISRQTYFCQPAPKALPRRNYQIINFLISKRCQYLIPRFDMRTECDHIWKVLRWEEYETGTQWFKFPFCLPPSL